MTNLSTSEEKSFCWGKRSASHVDMIDVRPHDTRSFTQGRRTHAPARGVEEGHVETDARDARSGALPSRGGAIRRTRARVDPSHRPMRLPRPVYLPRRRLSPALTAAPSARVSRRLRHPPDPSPLTEPRPTRDVPDRGGAPRRGDAGGGRDGAGHDLLTRPPEVRETRYASAGPRSLSI